MTNKIAIFENFRICQPYLRFMNDLKEKLAYKKEKTL